MVRDDRLEVALGQVRQRRHGVLVTQQRLRRHDHQRLAEQTDHLAAQQVEDLGRRGRLADLHVVVRAKLQEALDTGRAVFRALAFVAVRQHQRQARGAAPLHFTRRDELVDHHLGAVDEVAELGFPDHQRVRFGGRVAVFETEYGFFGQHRVDHRERCLVFRHILQRHVAAGIPALAVLVVQHGVAVGEGAAAGILAGDAHRVARGHQRGEGQVLAHAPVQRLVAAAHVGAVLDDLFHQRVQLQRLRRGGDALGQALQFGHRHGGVGGVGPLAVQERHPVHGELVLEVRQDGVGGVLAGVHRGAVFLDLLVAELGRDQVLRGQLVGVQPARAGVLGDLLVHQRLRDRRGVLLVVAQLAEADDVDHDVLVEFHAEINGQLHGVHHGFGIVAVHVQHRGLDHLDHVRAVQRRTRVARVGGGEADLVVDDDVHRAARAVAAGLREVQRLHHHALAGKGRVAVHLHRQHFLVADFAAAFLAGLGRAFDHRVDDFQVRRVERQRQVDRAAFGRDIAREALVVLDVTGRQVVDVLAFEFGEQVGGHLAQGVDQHVQAAAVGHADHDFLHALDAGLVDQLVHRDDEAFAAFEREALLADVLGVQEALQAFSRCQAVQDVLLLFQREHRLGTRGFQALLPPALLRLVAHVHEFETDGAAVGFAQVVEQLAQAHRLLAKVRIAGIEDDVEVSFGKTVERGVQIRQGRTLLALERVQVGPVRTDVAVGGDQLGGSDALAAHVGIGRGNDGPDGALLGALGERGNDGSVGDIPAVRAVDGGNVLHGVEVRTPVVGNRGGILEVGFVQFFDIRGVAAEEVRIALVLLHHGTLTILRVCRSSAGYSTFRDTA
ncbi:hypothetical protein D9M72_345210 [compost metagenome]